MTGLKSPTKIPKHIQSMLDVHYALWDFKSVIEVNNKLYNTRLASHAGYNSVIIPGKDDLNYFWITQNLNKSCEATHRIVNARQKGETRRQTWIINNNNGQFVYVGSIITHFYPKTDDTHIEVVKFSQYENQILYTSSTKIQDDIYS